MLKNNKTFYTRCFIFSFLNGHPFDEVMEVYLMTGDEDYLLRIVVPDLLTLEHFIVDHLTKIPGIKNIRSSFALKQIKYKTALPTPKIKTRR